MTAYLVDLEQLDGAAGRMADFESQIESRLSELNERMARLQAAWTGDAASAARSFHDQLAAGIQEMRDGLAAIQAAARTAHGNYTAAITANQSMWSGR